MHPLSSLITSLFVTYSPFMPFMPYLVVTKVSFILLKRDDDFIFFLNLSVNVFGIFN